MYHFNNMELGFGIPHAEIEKTNGNARMVSTSCREVIDEYFSSHTHLNHAAGERLIVV